MVKVIQENRDLVVGLKCRLSAVRTLADTLARAGRECRFHS